MRVLQLHQAHALAQDPTLPERRWWSHVYNVSCKRLYCACIASG